MKALGTLTVLLCSTWAATASADACDYRPSGLIGGGGASAIGAGSAASAGLGLAIKGAGFYTLTHTAGMTMVGSTLAGGSGAGTVGIIAGSGGAIGTLTAIVTAPVTIAVGAITAAGVGIYEGVCFFGDERITEYDDVLKVLLHVAATTDPEVFYLSGTKSKDSAFIRVKVAEGKMETFDVEDLYIVNSVLKNRDWGINTTIGNLYQIK